MTDQENNVATGSFPVVPAPDPGNSPPENWTESLSEEEQQEARDRAASEEEARPQTSMNVGDSNEGTTSSALSRGEVTVNFVEPGNSEEA